MYQILNCDAAYVLFSFLRRDDQAALAIAYVESSLSPIREYTKHTQPTRLNTSPIYRGVIIPPWGFRNWHLINESCSPAALEWCKCISEPRNLVTVDCNGEIPNIRICHSPKRLCVRIYKYVPIPATPTIVAINIGASDHGDHDKRKMRVHVELEWNSPPITDHLDISTAHSATFHELGWCDETDMKAWVPELMSRSDLLPSMRLACGEPICGWTLSTFRQSMMHFTRLHVRGEMRLSYSPSLQELYIVRSLVAYDLAEVIEACPNLRVLHIFESEHIQLTRCDRLLCIEFDRWQMIQPTRPLRLLKLHHHFDAKLFDTGLSDRFPVRATSLILYSTFQPGMKFQLPASLWVDNIVTFRPTSFLSEVHPETIRHLRNLMLTRVVDSMFFLDVGSQLNHVWIFVRQIQPIPVHTHQRIFRENNRWISNPFPQTFRPFRWPFEQVDVYSDKLMQLLTRPTTE